jgi:hypothetical protein
MFIFILVAICTDQIGIGSLQEHILSGKRLIFVNKHAYFTYREDICFEDNGIYGGTDSDFSNGMWPVFSKSFAEAFTTTVRLYTRHQFTNEIDIFKAGASFLRRLGENMKRPVFQGLPISIFDFALLSRRQYWSNAPDKISPRRVQFPGFRWAGWRGETFWDLEDISSSYEVLNMGTPDAKRFNDWLNQGTWIEHDELHPDGHSTKIWPVSEQERFSQLLVDFLG